MNVDLPENVRVEVIATLFGMSVRRVQQLTQEGIICTVKVKGQRGRLYPLRETVQAYTAYLNERQTGTRDTKQSLDEARIAKLELERRALETKVQIQEGEVHTTQDVELVMSDMLSAFRTRLWNLPQVLAPRLISVTDEQECKAIIKQEVTAMSGLLADYHADDFYQRNPEYMARRPDDSED